MTTPTLKRRERCKKVSLREGLKTDGALVGLPRRSRDHPFLDLLVRYKTVTDSVELQPLIRVLLSW